MNLASGLASDGMLGQSLRGDPRVSMLRPPQTLAQKRLDNEYDNDIHRGFLENSYPFLQVMPYNPNWHATGKLIIDSWQASVLTDEPIEDIIETAEKGLQSVLF